MTAVFMHARAELRRRWRSWLALSVLVALGGGVVISLSAGARRAGTAYPRFLRAERAADVFVFVDPGRAPQVPGLPEVADSASALGIQVAESDLVGVVLIDAAFGRQVNGFKMLAGRVPGPDRPDEAAVGFLTAQSRHLNVGSSLTIHLLPTRQAVELRVVGIEAAPGEFPPRFTSNRLPVYLSPSFVHTPVGVQPVNAGAVTQEIALRLRHGHRDVGPFVTDLYRALGGPAGFGALADQSANVQRSMHLQAMTLRLMAAFTGLAIAIVASQLLSRQGVEISTDDSALRALGMTPAQLLASGMLEILAMAAAGGMGSGIVAWALSPLLPLGTARIAEPKPGLAFDALNIGLGTATVVLVVGLLGAVALALARRRAAESDIPARNRPSSLGNALAAAPLPLVVAIGSRLALQPGRGRNAIPVRASLVAAAVGVGAIAASVTFSASLGHLLATPALYGVTFDARLEGNGNFTDIAQVVPALLADPAIAGVAVAETGIPMQAEQVHFGALTATTVKGSVNQTVIEGRLPQSPDEILLGSTTMHDLHTRIGQSIQVSVQGLTAPLPMRVVGRGVLAAVDDTEQLGRGAVLTPGALTVFAQHVGPGFKVPPPGDAFLTFRGGLPSTTGISGLQDRLAGAYDVSAFAPTQPTDVVNFGQVRNLPQALSGLLALMASATIAYLLVTSIRRRRRDLAILKTLGFLPRQVSAAIAWQATTLALVAALIGLPLGLAAGRSAWALVANQIGVVVQPVVPWLLVLGLLPAALVVANLVATGPAMAAGRIPPAVVLRSE